MLLFTLSRAGGKGLALADPGRRPNEPVYVYGRAPPVGTVCGLRIRLGTGPVRKDGAIRKAGKCSSGMSIIAAQSIVMAEQAEEAEEAERWRACLSNQSE